MIELSPDQKCKLIESLFDSVFEYMPTRHISYWHYIIGTDRKYYYNLLAQAWCCKNRLDLISLDEILESVDIETQERILFNLADLRKL